MGGSRGGDRGSGFPEKSQNIGYLSNTGPDPLKNHKATKPAFNVVPSVFPEKSQNIGYFSNSGPDHLKNHKATMPAFNVVPSSARQRNAIWSFNAWPMMARL